MPKVDGSIRETEYCSLNNGLFGPDMDSVLIKPMGKFDGKWGVVSRIAYAKEKRHLQKKSFGWGSGGAKRHST